MVLLESESERFFCVAQVHFPLVWVSFLFFLWGFALLFAICDFALGLFIYKNIIYYWLGFFDCEEIGR